MTVEPPRDPAHGDIATNAAMVLAKDAGRKPRELAEAIAEKLRADALVAKVDVAGPGFINLTLKPAAWIDGAARRGAIGRAIRRERHRRAACRSTSNMSRPIRPGRCMSAMAAARCSAMRLANLLAFAGFKVTREYYVNDAGAQVDVLARSAYLRYREALGEDIGAIPEGLYPGDYLKPVGAALAAQYEDALTKQPEAEWLPVVRAKAIEMMMATVRADLAALNINHEVFFSERSLIEGSVDQVAETIELAARSEATSMKAGCRRPKARPSRTGKIASRLCSARPNSATMSIGR